MKPPSARRPVFLDSTGRRRRQLRKAGAFLAVPVVGYLMLMVSSLLDGPRLDTPLVPLPEAATRPQQKPPTTPQPAAIQTLESEVTQTPDDSSGTPSSEPSDSPSTTPSGTPVSAITTPVVVPVTPTVVAPTHTTGSPTVPPGKPTTVPTTAPTTTPTATPTTTTASNNGKKPTTPPPGHTKTPNTP